LASTTASHASARYVSSLTHSRHYDSTSASTSYTTLAPNEGSVTSTASPNAEPASACTGVFGGARTHAKHHATHVDEVQDGQHGAGIGGELRRKVVVRVDDAQAGEGEELSEGIDENEGEGHEEVLVN
jgi:hypothetical protein